MTGVYWANTALLPLVAKLPNRRNCRPHRRQNPPPNFPYTSRPFLRRQESHSVVPATIGKNPPIPPPKLMRRCRLLKIDSCLRRNGLWGNGSVLGEYGIVAARRQIIESPKLSPTPSPKFAPKSPVHK